jgi:hypothetical protein
MREHLIILFVISFQIHYDAQQRSDASLRVIAFWNLENLYDTLDDPLKNDNEFLPGGSYRWTGERYWAKIDRLSEVISKMGTDVDPLGPSLLGVCEVENASVLSDLVKAPRIKKREYRFVLIEGPDARGVDPALIYNPKHFKLSHAKSYGVRLYGDTAHRTRDILLVCGEMDGEPLAVLVNHWPSRRGGELLSRRNRIAAARVAKRVADSVVRSEHRTKVVMLGDFNDDPVSESIVKHLGTYGAAEVRKDGTFFNATEKPYKEGIGTLAWQDSWNLFDQIILNPLWLDTEKRGWRYHDVRIYNKVYLRSDHGNFKGYPFRTYSGGNYTGGYSDHFPSYIIIRRVED